MNKTALLPKVLDEIFAITRHPRGALGQMEDCEIGSGYTLVPVGAVTPFPIPAKDWEAALVTLDGEKARLVLLHASAPGTGAFRRLVEGVKAAGYTPAVIEPTGADMPAIMKRWRWKRRQVGRGFDTYSEYTPRN